MLDAVTFQDCVDLEAANQKPLVLISSTWNSQLASE